MAKFFYDMADTFEHADYEYWSEEEIAKVRLIPWSEEAEAEINDECSTLCTLWPVSDIDGYSWDFAECEDEDDARKKLMLSLNQSIFEYVHDI